MKKRVQPMSDTLKEVQIALRATDTQMCRHLKMSASQFEAIRTGARVLPLPSQKTLTRRIERLYELCGISTTQLKQ